MIAIEKTNEYNGLYHVLGGVLSPLSGVNAHDLKIKDLLVVIVKVLFSLP